MDFFKFEIQESCEDEMVNLFKHEMGDLFRHEMVDLFAHKIVV